MVKKFLPFLILTVLVFALLPHPAYAAKTPSGPSEQVGYDVSYPQCGKRLPIDFYFAVVGVNGGTASSENSCLAAQLGWAAGAKTGSNQPRVQMYVNTANPGEVKQQITTWPNSPYDSNGNLPNNPYGNTCSGDNDNACSWLYGWNRSIYTEGLFKTAALSKGLSTETSQYMWWLDVETMNTWQSGSTDALSRNTAAIEGFGAFYQQKGAPIGLYSTAAQWKTITGNQINSISNLRALPNWRPSGASLSNAKVNCTVAPLTDGGTITMTQYVVKNLDHNHSCI